MIFSLDKWEMGRLKATKSQWPRSRTTHYLYQAVWISSIMLTCSDDRHEDETYRLRLNRTGRNEGYENHLHHCNRNKSFANAVKM